MPECRKRVILGLAGAMALSACSSSRPGGSSPAEAWRLIPESTVLGERRQFFVYGRGLDSAQVTGPKSVTVEKGWLKPDGRVLSVYLTLSAIEDDSTALSDKPGARRIQVVTPDTSVTLKLKVLNEIPR